MLKLSARVLLLLAALGAFPTSSAALRFTPLPHAGPHGRVLLIHDCEAIAENVGCVDEENGFTFDDEKKLVREWRGPYDEVWLLSGGGNLYAGIQIAKQLRAWRVTVRVPGTARLQARGRTLTRPYHCVSSCTVAFMGGQFRFIDPDATYEVHASSAVSWGNLKTEQVQTELTTIKSELESDAGLRAVANRRVRGAVILLREMFTVFQEALWLPIADARTDAERRARDNSLDQWVDAGRGRGYRYADAQLARDTEVMALEGNAALQDILMRIERENTSQALDDLRVMAPRLGRRAEAALAMLAAMYDTSSIKETNVVPRETLVKMGYVTEFVGAQ